MFHCRVLAHIRLHIWLRSVVSHQQRGVARQLGGGVHAGLFSLVSQVGVHTLVRLPWLCNCHAALSHAQETSQCHGRVGACSSSCSIQVGCDRVYRPCNGDTAVDATPAQSTIPWNQIGGSRCHGTRIEWTLAESVDEVGGPQCVV